MATRTEVSSPAADPGAFAAEARRAVEGGAVLRLRIEDADLEISGELALGVIGLLAAAGAGSPVDITRLPVEVTTGQAADLLGVTRPTVIALIERGELSATRVGTHRRLNTVEVLVYRQRSREERSAALDEVAAISDELGLYDDF